MEAPADQPDTALVRRSLGRLSGVEWAKPELRRLAGGGAAAGGDRNFATENGHVTRTFTEFGGSMTEWKPSTNCANLNGSRPS